MKKKKLQRLIEEAVEKKVAERLNNDQVICFPVQNFGHDVGGEQCDSEQRLPKLDNVRYLGERPLFDGLAGP